MTLLLDPDIRDWVVLPLFVIMVAAGLLRQSLGIVLQSNTTTTTSPKVSLSIARSTALLRQCMKVRSNAAHYLSTDHWNCRKEHAIQLLRTEIDGLEHKQQQQKKKNETTTSKDNKVANNDEEVDKDNDDDDDDEDPMSAMMNNPLSMIKGNMAFMIQNMIMMQGIQHFFSGFILLKVPFPLTIGFKSMFQRGLGTELPDLDSSYVSSVSWYFLVMYGLRSFLQLILGEPVLEIREQAMKTIQYGYTMPGQQQQQRIDRTTMIQQLRQEVETLEVFLQQHKSEFDTVEKRLLGYSRYPKKMKSYEMDSHDQLFLNATTTSTTTKKQDLKKKKKVT